MSEYINYCLTCGCYDPDYGCTMSSLHLSYACPFECDDDLPTFDNLPDHMLYEDVINADTPFDDVK